MSRAGRRASRSAALLCLFVGCRARAPEPAPSSPPAPASVEARAPAEPPPEPEVPDAGADASSSDAAPAAALADAGEAPVESEDPPGLVYFGDENGQFHDAACGSYRVETRVDPKTYLTSVSVIDGQGKTRLDFRSKDGVESYGPVWCFDVTGDGVPELLITHSSGGAHCCHRHQLYSLGSAPKLIVTYDAGNGSNYALSPRQLDGKGPFELLDTNDALTQVGSTAYAFTLFLPVVFSYQHGRYVKATRSFPDYLKKERDKALVELEKDCGAGCWQGTWAEYALGLSLLIGDWDAFAKTQHIAPKDLAALARLKTKLAPLLR